MKKTLPILIITAACLLSGCSDQPQAASQRAAIVSEQPNQISKAENVSQAPAGVLDVISPSYSIDKLYRNRELRPVYGLGLFKLCTDGVEDPALSHYDAYRLSKEGQLLRMDDQIYNSSYTIDDLRYRITFDWTEHEGQHVLTYVDPLSDGKPIALSDNGSKMLFMIKDHHDGTQASYSQYPVLLDLSTGELKDLLEKVNSSALSKISNVALSADGNSLLLAQDGGALYFLDVEKGSIYSLDELSSEPVKGCALAGGQLICWNQSKDESNGTVGDHKFWYIDLKDMKRHEMPKLETFTDISTLRFAHLAGFDSQAKLPFMFPGSSYALCTQGNGQTFVLDLYNWQLKPVLGYTLPASNVTCTGSFDGQRLLIQDLDRESAVVLSYSDMKLVRLKASDVSSIRWFDPDSLIQLNDEGKFDIFQLEKAEQS